MKLHVHLEAQPHWSLRLTINGRRETKSHKANRI